jgi:prepilin-type N-terminal cleavage/methylation domain-containing protein
MKRIIKRGFTLVEIIVVCGVVAVFMGTVISLFVNFQQGYSKSESSAVLLQESALLLAQMRNDMNNAVLNAQASANSSAKQFVAEKEQLSFNIYDNRAGKIYPVVYRLSGPAGQQSLSRRPGSGSEKTIIKGSVASLSWATEVENFSGAASGTIRLSLKVAFSLKTERGSEKPFSIKTRIFPARLNRQLNNK